MFESPEPRMRYEAQRKLCLTKLLFDVDHCRSVRDGSRHRESFERLLRRSLWALQHGTYEVRCRNDGQACASGTDTANTQGAGGYLRFEVRHLALPGEDELRVAKPANPSSKGEPERVLTEVARCNTQDLMIASGVSWRRGEPRFAKSVPAELADDIPPPGAERDAP